MDFRGTEGIPYVKLSALEVGIEIERFVLGKGETSEAGTVAMLEQGWSLYPPTSSPSSSCRPGYSHRCSLGDRHRHRSVVLSLLALSCPSSLSSLSLLFTRPYRCPIVIIVSVHSCRRRRFVGAAVTVHSIRPLHVVVPSYLAINAITVIIAVASILKV